MADEKLDNHPDSIYGVICSECGPQGLTKREYDKQMNRPDAGWVCPECGGYASWDDDRYEKGMGWTSPDSK